LIRGDISNETPPRLIVIIDVVADSEIKETKKLLRTSKEKILKTTNNVALAHLWKLATSYGLSVELAAFEDEGWSQELLDKLMDKLDRRGANPFNYAELYSSVSDFVSDMPYRMNLKGIVDLPSQVARYGSFGIELNNL